MRSFLILSFLLCIAYTAPAQTADAAPPGMEMVAADSFSIAKYKVTQAQWKDLMGGNNPSDHKDCDQCPVENVTWDEVQVFLVLINARTGKNYRLPTAAEWLYAANGGSKTHNYTYAGSNKIKEVAWYQDNAHKESHPVGLKAPNELGLYDMTGNVYEFCSDWADAAHTQRVVHGCGFNYPDGMCTNIFTTSRYPNIQYSNTGFRVVMSR